MIHCGEAKGKHTAVLIAQTLDEVLDNLNLPEDKFSAITTDNARNMLNATQKKAKTIDMGLGCLDHLLQLVVNKSIDKVPGTSSATPLPPLPLSPPATPFGIHPPIHSSIHPTIHPSIHPGTCF